MTLTPLSRSKVKGQGHQAALLSAALTRKAVAAVNMGTYSEWQSTATLRCSAAREALGRHGGAVMGTSYKKVVRLNYFFN